MNIPVSASSNVRIVDVEDWHLSDLARLHRLALPNGFLSTLGDPFIASLYLGISSTPRSVVLVAIDMDGAVLGFISGACDVRACYVSILKRRGLSLLIRLAPSLRHSAVWRRAWETLTYPFRKNDGVSTGSEAVPPGKAELLSIAVSGKARGKGVGRTLVNALDERFRGFGLEGDYRVVTDALDSQSNAFYERMEFRHELLFKHHGHPMNLYLKDCGSS